MTLAETRRRKNLTIKKKESGYLESRGSARGRGQGRGEVVLHLNVPRST